VKADLPAALRERPFDVRRKIPVPYFNTDPEGRVDFTGIDYGKAVECGVNRLCGLCGKPLTYWIAFVGGPLSLANRTYSDPPFHQECAKAAMALCPFLRVQSHRRTPEEKFGDDSWHAPEADMNKPVEWIIGVTRDYRMMPHAGGILFLPKPIHHLTRYRYNDNGILEETNG
jgi:hypothetical protein